METFGNDGTTRRSYDVENRLKTVQTWMPGPGGEGPTPLPGGGGPTPLPGEGPTPVQALVYDYDPQRGLLQNRHDFMAMTSEDFELDFLTRLTKWTVYQDGRRSVLSYGYDDTGNLLSRTVLEGLGRTWSIRTQAQAAARTPSKLPHPMARSLAMLTIVPAGSSKGPAAMSSTPSSTCLPA